MLLNNPDIHSENIPILFFANKVCDISLVIGAMPSQCAHGIEACWTIRWMLRVLSPRINAWRSCGYTRSGTNLGSSRKSVVYVPLARRIDKCVAMAVQAMPSVEKVWKLG